MPLRLGIRSSSENDGPSFLNSSETNQGTVFGTIRRLFNYRRSNSSTNLIADIPPSSASSASIPRTPDMPPSTADSTATLDLKLPLPLDGSFIDETFNNFKCTKIRPSHSKKRPQIPQDWMGSRNECELSPAGVTGLLPQNFHPNRAASSASTASNAPSLASSSSADSASFCSDFGSAPNSPDVRLAPSPSQLDSNMAAVPMWPLSRNRLSSATFNGVRSQGRDRSSNRKSDRLRVSFRPESRPSEPPSTSSSGTSFTSDLSQTIRLSRPPMMGEPVPKLPVRSSLRPGSIRVPSGSSWSTSVLPSPMSAESTEEEDEARDEVPALASEPTVGPGRAGKVGRRASGESLVRRRSHLSVFPTRPLNVMHPSNLHYDRDAVGRPVPPVGTDDLGERLSRVIGQPTHGWKARKTASLHL